MPLITYGLILVSLILAGPLLALAASKPVPGEIALVIAPDAEARRAMIVAAGGRLVGLADAPFGALAISGSEGFATRLRAHGAWMVADGRRVAFLCGVDT